MRLELWFADLAALAPILEREESAVARLGADEVARAAAMPSETMRGEWRAAHIALRVIIERWAGVGHRREPYRIATGGRPELGRGEVSFSLSHTSGLALIACAGNGPIGADIERTRRLSLPPERHAAIIAEGQRLCPLTPLAGTLDAQFLQAWVRLEAASKARGSGIGQALSDAGIIGDKDRKTSRNGQALAVRDVPAGEFAGTGTYAAVAAPELPPVLNVNLFPASESGLQALLKPLI